MKLLVDLFPVIVFFVVYKLADDAHTGIINATIAAIVAGAFLLGGHVLGWSLLAGGIVLLWLFFACQLLYRQWSVQYELTSQRFIHRSGILARTTDRIEVIDMDDITFQQNFVERLVNVGTVKITSSDKTHPEILLKGIEDVKPVADLIDSARRKERVRRGVHIEAV